MRILIQQPMLLHYRDTFFSALARSSHHEIIVAHSGAEPTCSFLAYSDVKLPCASLDGLSWQRGLVALLDRQFDLLVGSWNPRFLSTVALWHRFRGPFVWWGHGLGRLSFARRFRLWLLKRSAGAILYGPREAVETRRYAGREARLFVAPNTLAVPNAGRSDDANRSSFLFVGRLTKRKDVNVLLQAYARQRRKLPEHTTLDIVGDGPEAQHLRELARRLGISASVIFHGPIHEPEKLKSLFDRAVAYVSPGPIGLGLVHAFAYGVPVLTCIGKRHGPEFQYFTHGVTGLIVDPGVSGVAAGLLELVHSQDESERMGRRALQVYQRNLRFEQMVEAFEDALVSCA